MQSQGKGQLSPTPVGAEVAAGRASTDDQGMKQGGGELGADGKSSRL